MTFRATSEKNAERIFSRLEKLGYSYYTTYLYMQEWRKGASVALVLKAYGYQAVNYGY